MVKFEIHSLKEDGSFLVYCFFTLFMIYFSTSAIHTWPNLLSQLTIFLACILPVLLALIKNISRIVHIKNWPSEVKFVLIIITLGILNICFSEDRQASYKGMGLFLISGIMIFSFTFFIFRSKLKQQIFYYLCTVCLLTLIIFGIIEFVQQINYPGKRILLFSDNPIPAGSLLILLSSGPIMLFEQTKTRWGKNALLLCLVMAVLIIILIGQRGPILAILIMASIWAAQRNKRLGIFSLIILILLGIGFQFRDQIPIQYKDQLLKTETIFVRLEFYNVAWQVVKDKPFFGIGFNAPLTKYISKDYEPKIYPADSKYTFQSIITGGETFDNMALFFLAQTGLLFSGAYVCLIFCLINILIKNNNENMDIKQQRILLLIILIGFSVHSMTYESLRYPHLNWLFHSLLGLVANNHVFRSKIL